MGKHRGDEPVSGDREECQAGTGPWADEYQGLSHLGFEPTCLTKGPAFMSCRKMPPSASVELVNW